MVHKEEWSCPSSLHHQPMPLPSRGITPQRTYLPIVRYSEHSLFSNLRFIKIQAPEGNLCWKAWLTSLYFAIFYSLHGAFKEASSSIDRVINCERLVCIITCSITTCSTTTCTTRGCSLTTCIFRCLRRLRSKVWRLQGILSTKIIK